MIDYNEWTKATNALSAANADDYPRRITLEGMTIFNPTEEQLRAAGWVKQSELEEN